MYKEKMKVILMRGVSLHSFSDLTFLSQIPLDATFFCCITNLLQLHLKRFKVHHNGLGSFRHQMYITCKSKFCKMLLELFFQCFHRHNLALSVATSLLDLWHTGSLIHIVMSTFLIEVGHVSMPFFTTINQEGDYEDQPTYPWTSLWKKCASSNLEKQPSTSFERMKDTSKKKKGLCPSMNFRKKYGFSWNIPSLPTPLESSPSLPSQSSWYPLWFFA